MTGDVVLFSPRPIIAPSGALGKLIQSQSLLHRLFTAACYDGSVRPMSLNEPSQHMEACLLYTSDAADERSSVDLGGRRIIKKKTQTRYDGEERHR